MCADSRRCKPRDADLTHPSTWSFAPTAFGWECSRPPDAPGTAQIIYVGRVKSYNPKQGYGFLESAEAKEHFGRDVFIHKAQMGELLDRFLGRRTRLDPAVLKMLVQFSVEINNSGMPQARDVLRVDDLQEPSAIPSSPELAAPPASEGCLLDPLQSKIGNLDTKTSPDPATSSLDVQGYKGRGGTIRILNEVEVANSGAQLRDAQRPESSDSFDGPCAAPSPSASPGGDQFAFSATSSTGGEGPCSSSCNFSGGCSSGCNIKVNSNSHAGVGCNSSSGYDNSGCGGSCYSNSACSTYACNPSGCGSSGCIGIGFSHNGCGSRSCGSTGCSGYVQQCTPPAVESCRQHNYEDTSFFVPPSHSVPPAPPPPPPSSHGGCQGPGPPTFSAGMPGQCQSGPVMHISHCVPVSTMVTIGEGAPGGHFAATPPSPQPYLAMHPFPHQSAVQVYSLQDPQGIIPTSAHSMPMGYAHSFVQQGALPQHQHTYQHPCQQQPGLQHPQPVPPPMQPFPPDKVQAAGGAVPALGAPPIGSLPLAVPPPMQPFNPTKLQTGASLQPPTSPNLQPFAAFPAQERPSLASSLQLSVPPAMQPFSPDKLPQVGSLQLSAPPAMQQPLQPFPPFPAQGQQCVPPPGPQPWPHASWPPDFDGAL